MAAGQSLLALYEIMVDRELGSAERAYERLTQQIPDGRAPTGQNNAPAPVTVPPALVALRAALGEAARQVPGLRGAALSEDVQNALARADRLHLRFATGLDGKEHREYQVRAAVWEGAGKWLARTKAGGGGAPAGAVPAPDQELAEWTKQLASLGAAAGASPRLKEAGDAARRIAEWSAGERRREVAISGVRGMGTAARPYPWLALVARPRSPSGGAVACPAGRG